MFGYDQITIEIFKKLSESKDLDGIIQSIFNLSEKDMDEMDMDEYTDLITKVGELKNYIPKRYKYFELSKSVKLGYKDFKNLTLGEYIDIQTYIKNNDIHKLYCIFWRRIEKQGDIFDVDKLEDYSFDINHRSKIFNNQSIKYYFQIQSDLNKLDELIKKNFKIIFEDDVVEEKIDEIKDARLKAQYLHEKKIKESYNKNAWQYVAYSLAKGESTKLEEVYNLPLFRALSTLKLEREMEIKNKK